MRLMYDLWYRFGTPPWVQGARSELVSLVDAGKIKPGRAIDLGCGVGSDAIFLAQHGFDVTGVDFAVPALKKARAAAAKAGVRVDWDNDDISTLRKVDGQFDLIVDYGSFDDLKPRARPAYLRTIERLVHDRTLFLMWCFEWEARWWERALSPIFGGLPLRPGEVQELFSDRWAIGTIASERQDKWPYGYGCYLMTRRST